MNTPNNYNYGPQNYSLINNAISDIRETIGDPSNPADGTIYSDIDALAEIIGNPDNPSEDSIFYKLENKQDKLTAGDGISITNNVISVNYEQANGVSF